MLNVIFDNQEMLLMVIDCAEYDELRKQRMTSLTCSYHGYAMREVTVNYTSLYETH